MIFPCVAAVTASTVPSPPSATGRLMQVQLPNTSFAAFVSSTAVSLLDRLPLKLSETNNSLILPPPFCRYYSTKTVAWLSQNVEIGEKLVINS